MADSFLATVWILYQISFEAPWFHLYHFSVLVLTVLALAAHAFTTIIVGYLIVSEVMPSSIQMPTLVSLTFYFSRISSKYHLGFISIDGTVSGWGHFFAAPYHFQYQPRTLRAFDIILIAFHLGLLYFEHHFRFGQLWWLLIGVSEICFAFYSIAILDIMVFSFHRPRISRDYFPHWFQHYTTSLLTGDDTRFTGFFIKIFLFVSLTCSHFSTQGFYYCQT
jgi:hypothetical protein